MLPKTNKMRIKRSGFTLIELLVAITIFSGVMILSLGAFARSASSAFKVSATREKTEAARRIVDQISNDFQYIYIPQSDSNNQIIGQFSDDCAAKIKGFCFTTGEGANPSSAELLLQYPGDTKFVKKVYKFMARSTSQSIFVAEQRDCEFDYSGAITNTPKALTNCLTAGTLKDMLDDKKYAIDAVSLISVFDGLTVLAGAARIPPQKGYLKINLKIKPVNNTPDFCTSNPSGDSCYQLKTTLTPGGI